MVHKNICASICDRLPSVSANHPWFVDQNLEEDSRDHIVYTMRDPPSQHRCRIPSFLGRRIRGCFHGWVIFSNHPHNDMWSLWNPVTFKIIRLPNLTLGNGDRGLDIAQECCLSSPPDDHGSIFILTTKKQTIFFCRLDCKRKRLKWVEMSYAEQMRSIDCDDGVLFSMTCCNGKVYSLSTACAKFYVIRIVIVVKGTEIAISPLRYMKVPIDFMDGRVSPISFLKGCCTELFHIALGLNEVGHVTKRTVGVVRVYKLDMKKKRWNRLEDLKDAAFFLDLAHGYSVFYSPAVASEFGGYVHFLDKSAEVIHSYDFKNKTIALSSMPTSHAPLLEHRLLQGDHGEIKYKDRENDEVDGNSTRIEENTESRLLNIPFDVLKMIIEFCVGVEYLNFRATCKQIHLAAPMVRWSKGGRLQTYSLASPWLMVLHKDRGVISFTDPMFGHEYFIKTPPQLIGVLKIYCSMYGWLLIRTKRGPLMFFNPFTCDICEIPEARYYLESYCFSAPPTSPDCIVAGFSTHPECNVYIHLVGREPSWRGFRLNISFCRFHSFHFATRYHENLYAVYYKGGVGFIDTENLSYTWRGSPRRICRSAKQNFLVKCDQRLLLVIVGEFGEPVEVFKWNDSSEWEKTESLGRHTIYIGGKTCLCIEAETPEMANRIYFPRLHSENRKIVFYSLEMRKYHTSNIKESFGDFMGTKHHLDLHMWIEPSWSQMTDMGVQDPLMMEQQGQDDFDDMAGED